jgi:hypothetical protein
MISVVGDDKFPRQVIAADMGEEPWRAIFGIAEFAAGIANEEVDVAPYPLGLSL